MTRFVQSGAQPPKAAGQAPSGALERARVLFESRIEEQIIRIEQCRLDVAGGRAPGRALGEIAAHAHKMSGVAATVGHPRVGQLAGTIETLIGRGRQEGLSETAILQAIGQDLETLLDALEAVLEP